MPAMFPHWVDDHDCPACVASAHGICDWHLAGLVPGLAVPWWVWLIGLTIASQRASQPAPSSSAPLSVSPEAAAHAERKRRSRRPRKSRAVVRARRHGVAGLVRAIAQTQTAPV